MRFTAGHRGGSGPPLHRVDDDEPVDAPAGIELTVIGVVESPLRERSDAPRQADEGAPAAWLAFEPDVAPALDGIGPGDELLVLTSLDRARRDVLRVHPRGEARRPEQGVFATR